MSDAAAWTDKLKRMALFAEIVDSGSISATARRVGSTPSAVSQQLRLLEGALGLVLPPDTAARLLGMTTGVITVHSLRRTFQNAQAIGREVGVIRMPVREQDLRHTPLRGVDDRL